MSNKDIEKELKSIPKEQWHPEEVLNTVELTEETLKDSQDLKKTYKDFVIKCKVEGKSKPRLLVYITKENQEEALKYILKGVLWIQDDKGLFMNISRVDSIELGEIERSE